MVLAPALDLVGAVAFLGAFVQAARLYRRQRLLRNYWLIAATGAALLGVWAFVEAAEGLNVAPVALESRLQILVLTTGLTAVLLLALYDNTEGEALLRRLETSERRTSTIVERFPRGAVVLLDDDYDCLLAGGDDLFGRADCATLAGRHLPDVVDEEVQPTVRRLCDSALDGRPGEGEVTMGEETYQVQALPLDEPETGRSCLLVVRNVTVERQRERALRDQHAELETLDRINRVIREVDQALVGADSRESIEEAVCDRLTANDPYEFALVAERTADGRFRPRVWRGSGDSYVEEVFPIDPADAADSPGAKAVETGEIQVVQDVEHDPAFGPWREPALRQEFRALAAVPIRYGGRTYGVLGVYADRPNAFDEREQDVLAQFGETVGHAITAVERKERADVLTALHGVTRELLHAQTAEDVCDVVLEAGGDLLDLEIGVFGYDEQRGVLELLAATFDPIEFYGSENPRFTGESESVTWETFVSGEPVVFDDVRDAQHLAVADTDARSTMFVPLGEHGLFVAGSAAVGDFDEQNRKLVELLAATTEAAFDRLDSEGDLREREAELRERTQRLQRLQQINDVIREVNQAVVSAGSREEIEQTVCDRLTATDRCPFAWVGTAGEGVTPRAWAGNDASYLDEVEAEFPADGDATTDEALREPGVATLRSGEPTQVSPLSEHVRTAPWAAEAVSRGFRAALSVPLVHQHDDYGALTIYSGSADMFDDETTAVMRELGETVAYAISAVETKRGLHAARGTELELTIPGRTTFLNDVATLSDNPVECVEAVPESNGRTRVHFLAPGLTVADLDSLADDSVVVERVDAAGHDGVFRATVSGETLTETVVDSGAVPESIEATAEGTTFVVSLLPHVDARTFVERLADVYDGVELLARRETGPRLTRSAFRSEFESALTDRQREVLRTAYESGYFESPRESTGQDVADRLGISQPTVNHHLRESQRRLLGLLFEDTEEVSVQRDD
jgi:GAF domain-containing protein/predicted DNA binding protein